MGPRDSRDLTETNGNVYPVGKGKGRAKISRTSSNASFGDLPSEAMDAGIAAKPNSLKGYSSPSNALPLMLVVILWVDILHSSRPSRRTVLAYSILIYVYLPYRGISYLQLV